MCKPVMCVGVLSRDSLKFLGTPRAGGSPHLGFSAFMRKPIPLASAFTVPSLHDPHLQPHPNPEAQAAEMACKRIFLITETPSSPRPSLLLPPSPSNPPCFFSSPPSFLSPCLHSTLTHAGREGENRQLSNFSHFSQMLSKVISGRAERQRATRSQQAL